MAKTLKQMLEVYRPKAGDEQKFVDKHTVQKTEDANGNGDEVFNASNVKKINRKKDNHGYEIGEDEKVYEESEIDEVTLSLLEIYSECDDEEKQALISIIENDQLDEFFNELEEELNKEEI